MHARATQRATRHAPRTIIDTFCAVSIARKPHGCVGRRAGSSDASTGPLQTLGATSLVAAALAVGVGAAGAAATAHASSAAAASAAINARRIVRLIFAMCYFLEVGVDSGLE
jgi:hypothetical protein